MHSYDVTKAAAQGAKAENVDLATAADALSTVMRELDALADQFEVDARDPETPAHLTDGWMFAFQEAADRVRAVAIRLQVNRLTLADELAEIAEQYFFDSECDQPLPGCEELYAVIERLRGDRRG